MSCSDCLLDTIVSYRLTDGTHDSDEELLNIIDDDEEDADEVETVVVMLDDCMV